MENDLDKAESAFRNAISLNDQKAESFVGLAQVLFEKNHPKLSLIEAEQALALDPKCAAAYHQVAMATAHLGDLESAVSHYAKAMELNPDLTASRLALGHLELEQGNFDNAREHFELALETADEKLSALIALSKLEKTAPDSPIFKALEDHLSHADTMLPQKATAYHFAMGECYEHLQRYEDAFNQFSKGASLKRSLVQYDASEADRLTDELIETFNTQLVDRLRNYAVDSDRPIFVLGMPRSGTTVDGIDPKCAPDGFWGR